MGMFSSIAKEFQAGQILTIIDKCLEKCVDKPDVIEALGEIREEVDELRKEAAAGW